MINNKIVTAKNIKIGLKVIPGRDWGYSSQAANSEYGIITSIDGAWAKVEWMKNNSCIGSNKYRYGSTESGQCDLYLYIQHLIKPEFEKEAKKFFKINNLNKITREMLQENHLEHFITENS